MFQFNNSSPGIVPLKFVPPPQEIQKTHLIYLRPGHLNYLKEFMITRHVSIDNIPDEGISAKYKLQQLLGNE